MLESSDGGKKAGDGTTASGLNNATGYLIGGPIPNHEEDDDSIAGFTASMVSSFGHSINFHVENSNETRLYAPASDAQGIYDDPNTFFAKVEGDSNNASFIGGKGGKAGTGLYVKLDDANECLNYVAANLAVTAQDQPQIDVESGCLIAEGMRPGGGNAYIAHDASNVSFPGSYLLKTDFFYEDDTARGNTSMLGARLDSAAANNLINGNTGGAPAPMDGTDLQIVPPDSQLGRVLQDGFGGATSFTGRRANGTNASKTALADGDVIAALEGSGYTGATNGYTASPVGGFSVQACEAWSSSANCAATTLKATEKGTTTVTEVARAESGGFGIGTGEGVSAPLEVLNTGTTTHASNIHALLTSGTGSIAVTSAAGFPSPGILLVDSELMSYSKIDGTHLNVTARGVWGTTAQSHSNNSGSTLSFLNVLVGNNSSTLPQFAVTSRGGVWHLTTSGGAPAIDQTGGGGAGAGSPTIVGNDNAGRITLGTPASAVLKLNFATPWSNAPVCFAQDESATARNPWIVTAASTSSVTFTGPGTPSNGDVLSYACTGFK